MCRTFTSLGSFFNVLFFIKKIYHAGFQMLSMALQKLNISPSYNNPLQATNNHNRVLNPLLSLFTHVLLKLVEMMGTEVFFNKFSHKVCLSMHPQSLHLSHILKKNICWNFVIRISSETIFQIIHIKTKADQSSNSLPGHTCTWSCLLQFTAGRENTLEFRYY